MRKTFKLTYECGLHARPCTSLFSLLKPFNSTVKCICGVNSADAKSVLELLSMGVQAGDVTFEVNGQDAESAMRAIELFINKLNNEKQW
jgi:phosphocarrier protein